jgi:hypothetical protein
MGIETPYEMIAWSINREKAKREFGFSDECCDDTYNDTLKTLLRWSKKKTGKQIRNKIRRMLKE